MSALERIGLDETIAERLLAGLRDDDVNVLEDTVIESFERPEGDGDGESLWTRDANAVQPIRFRLAGAKDKEPKGSVEFVDGTVIDADAIVVAAGYESEQMLRRPGAPFGALRPG